jgi:hypothetical protein
MAYLTKIQEDDGVLRMEVHEHDESGVKLVGLLFCSVDRAPHVAHALRSFLGQLDVIGPQRSTG